MARRKKAAKRRKAVVVKINKPRRKRSRRRTVTVMANPRRRRSSRRRSYRASRRSYRRNPGLLPSTGFVTEALYVTGGWFATRLTSGMVLPMLGGIAEQPIMRILGKSAVAIGLGWVGGNFIGKRNGQLVMLGGFVEALSDAVQTYVSPFVPALADNMASYPSLPMSSYPALADAYSDPYSVGASQFEEAV